MSAALPFLLSRSSDVISGVNMRSTTETAHGLLRLDTTHLVVQWRVRTSTDMIGSEIRSDAVIGEVQEVRIPLDGVAGAAVRERRFLFRRSVKLVLTAADLRAFEPLVGASGLQSEHPAEVQLTLQRADALAAREFCAELAMVLAERWRERSSRTLDRADAPQALNPGATGP